MRRPTNSVISRNNHTNSFCKNVFLISENMIKGLDDDEIEFLDLVDRTKLAADRRKTLEEEQELNDYRNRVATLQEKALQDKLQVTVAKPKVTSNGKRSQTKLLLGAVVKRNESQKRKIVDGKPPSKQLKVSNGESGTEVKSYGQNTGLKCIGLLPGIGPYTDSSSEQSSDSEVETSAQKIDLLGRKIIIKKDKEHSE